jgi:hypothetical protein
MYCFLVLFSGAKVSVYGVPKGVGIMWNPELHSTREFVLLEIIPLSGSKIQFLGISNDRIDSFKMEMRQASTLSFVSPFFISLEFPTLIVHCHCSFFAHLVNKQRSVSSNAENEIPLKVIHTLN